VNQAVLVCSLQSTANLIDNPYEPFDCEPGAGGINEVGKRNARQKWHYKKRLPLASLFNLANVPNVDDIGVTDTGEDTPLFAEQLDGCGIGNIAHGLQSNKTLCF
jgi:hypothetical protein